MSDHSPWPQHDIRRAPNLVCPHADTWQHADIAESLAMPIGTLLRDEDGLYCPACDYRPDRAGPFAGPSPTDTGG
jgi:hypothetical protein